MKIIVNGENQEITANCTAAGLIRLLQLDTSKIAMEVNREILPKSTFENHTFNEGDSVEIVRAIGGG